MNRDGLSLEQQKLVEENIKLIYKVINDKFEFLYSSVGVDMEDVEQVGKLALCKAAKAFNPEKSKFSTFAYLIIRQDLVDYITENRIISENECSPEDYISSAELESLSPVDACDLIEDKSAQFADSFSFDLTAAFESFFNDESVRDSLKDDVRAFLYYYSTGCTAIEAGMRFGAKTEGTARNLVFKGREVLKNREEFRCLWEELSA